MPNHNRILTPILAAAMGVVLSLAAIAPPARAAVSVRLQLGVGDTAATRWDGDVTARGARIAALEPWRFEDGDAISAGNHWKASTRRIRIFLGDRFPKRPFVPNGVVVTLDGETAGTELNVHTAQGDFTVRLSDIPYGTAKSFLDGKVEADRVPATARLTSNADEQDYPAAAAGKDGSVWLAYMEFKHNPKHNRIRTTAKVTDDLTAKTGGDQVWLQHYASGAWSAPVAITPPGGDLYRPAVAVDGKGRPWVFWSSNTGGNFDVWARVADGLKPGATVRISSDPGSDIDPAAVADSSGRVWVAWQGWRNGKAKIFAAVQEGDGFSQPVTVASSAGNEWNPAIAADSHGRVAVAWDSYRNGQYDVFFRTATAPGAWGKEMPGAASARYEAYPSIAYDPAGVLWLAYEEGAQRWGKDFGAYESSGVSLYEGRAVRLRGFTPDGRVVAPSVDVGTALPGFLDKKNAQLLKGSHQSDSDDWLKPDESLWKNRGDNRSISSPLDQGRDTPFNSMPRLLADSSGRLWLAIRTKHPYWWNSIGSVWTEHLASYDGSTWTGGIYLHHTDNLLDNRPALVSAKPGELLLIGSSDGRRLYHAMSFAPGAKTSVKEAEVVKDPFQNDLYMSQVVLGPAAAMPAAKPASAVAVAGKDPLDKPEEEAVSAMRGYRYNSAQGELRILRGEFHRHSEISMDGANDGTIIDQYRYMLDAASMDWVGCCDHDNGGGREYSWWISQKLTDIFYNPGNFATMFHYERSVNYPEGHRNIIFAQRGVRVLPRLPLSKPAQVKPAPDTLMLYQYLHKYNGIVASHTSGTSMGTDWRNNDPDTEPVVEIYQGDRQNYERPDAPRTMTEKDAIGGYRPKGFINLALDRGYKLSFEASSDHISTHISYTNLLARDASREAVLEAFKSRHVYGSTDDVLAEFTCGGHMMGDAFASATPPAFKVKLQGTAPFAKIFVVKNNAYVYSSEAQGTTVDFTWRDTQPEKGKTSYYYVRGEQADGEIVWVSPMWVTYTGE
jgi:hypothetical protein